MTFSIVVRCERTGHFGVAAVTGTPGVGTLLTWAKADVGAIATQGWINPYLGIDGLDLLGNGHPADKALQAVVSLDDDRELRQAGAVDALGRSAAFTGGACADWCGHEHGDGWSVQGNLLEGHETLEACAKAYFDSEGKDLVERLMAALEAGEEAGGDRRGARSATVFVVASELYPLWDLRVDDHDDPLHELRRLSERLGETLLPQILKLPTRRDACGQLRADSDAGLV
ncbi:MAG: DUF1028 domain-containing protein [Nitriliruptorales bacterium]|nr:DUF1028 domain-containing protein [Nitriliruptorales bacterium]